MGEPGTVMRLYSVQHKNVVDVIQKEGTCFSKAAYIQQKYGESAPIFMAAYSWLAGQAPTYVPKPTGAQLHYWAFADEASFERYGDSRVLVLDVPVEEAIFFNLLDWNTILKLQYLAESEEDEACFAATLREQGVRHDSDVMLTGFYHILKRQVQESWQRLFRHHQQIAAGQRPFPTIQAALWQIRLPWVREVI